MNIGQKKYLTNMIMILVIQITGLYVPNVVDVMNGMIVIGGRYV
jgi:hypothetical protein